jgi:Tol biopolymer transport system component
MRAWRRTLWLAAIPVAVFALVFALSSAVFALDEEAPRATTTDRGVTRVAASSDEPPAATGDERIALALRGEGVGDSYAWFVSLDGSNPVRLSEPPNATTTVNDAYTAWSPDGSTIVLVRQVIDANGQPTPPHLYAIAPDGTDLRRLTRGPQADLLPTWSPDGSRIAFSRVTGESTDVFTMRSDGTDLRRLTSARTAHEDMPSYSPDGQLIAYARVEGGEDIWVMNADGTEQRELLGGEGHDASPDWSPDGERIAFVRDGKIAVMNADGTGIELLTSGEIPDAGPQWSPDGTRILFTRDPGQVLVMNADGTGLVRVPIRGQVGGPSWGPLE